MRYHWFSVLFFLIVVPLANFATPLSPWDDMHVKHTWHAVPVGWESLGHPRTSTTIDLYIALKAERENALIDALSEVSDPKHPRHALPFLRLYLHSRVPLPRFRYGEHLFKEQVAELVRPPSDTLELVRAWLVHHDIRSSSISTTHGGAWLTVTDVLVSQANQLLGASYELYRNTKTNETITRTVGYALPAVLHAQIEDIAPTTYFAPVRMTQQTTRRRSLGLAPEQAEVASGKPVTARSASRAGVTPSILRWLYGTETYVAAAAGRNQLGVVGFAGEYPSQEDLTRFTTSYDTYAADAAFTVVQVGGGGYNPNNPNERSNTNVQYAATMGYPTPLTFYSVGHLGDPFLTWLDYLVSQPNIPQTIAISYLDMEENVGPGYATAVCNLFGQLGLRGVSVLVASGINGVGAGDCVYFAPEFPSSCTCDILSLLHKYKYKSLTRPPRFRRSLGHYRRRYYRNQPRVRRELLRRRFLELLSAPSLSDQCGTQIPPGTRRQLSGSLQVRSLL